MSADGETMRALMCARIWASITASERTKYKTPAGLLPMVQDLMARSYVLGSPTSDMNPDQVLLDPTPFAAVRFREWLTRQSPEVQSLYTTPAP